jgi:hypothetical protein
LVDARFDAILAELREMHDRKNRDYGSAVDPYANVRASEDFGIPGWVGSVVRANDKMRRLQAAARGSDLANEGIRDSLIDNAVYFIIAAILFDEQVSG